MITTPIDHINVASQPFDLFFSATAKLANIGHNYPALQQQSAQVVYYYRAAHLYIVGSPEYKRCMRAAQGRIDLGRPMAAMLWRDLAAMISV